jgi:hypothetical protein
VNDTISSHVRGVEVKSFGYGWEYRGKRGFRQSLISGTARKKKLLYKHGGYYPFMRSPQEIRTIIERRLKNYLSRDRTGIRRALLNLFLAAKSLTIAQIFEFLNRQFSISYHSVAAMVGIIASKIGILHVTKDKEGTCSVYSLKAKYVETVERIVGTG